MKHCKRSSGFCSTHPKIVVSPVKEPQHLLFWKLAASSPQKPQPCLQISFILAKREEFGGKNSMLHFDKCPICKRISACQMEQPQPFYLSDVLRPPPILLSQFWREVHSETGRPFAQAKILAQDFLLAGIIRLAVPGGFSFSIKLWGLSAWKSQDEKFGKLNTLWRGSFAENFIHFCEKEWGVTAVFGFSFIVNVGNQWFEFKWSDSDVNNQSN